MGAVFRRITWQVIRKCIVPLSLLLVLFFAYFFYKTRIAPLISSSLQQDLRKYIGTIFIIWFAFSFQRITGVIASWYQEHVAGKTETHLDDELIPLIRRTLKIAIWIIAFLVILPFYGINISALVTMLGVSSLAIALAAQDTIANIIAGFLIMVDRPFRLRDTIKLPSGEIVQVLDIGVRRSRFLAEDKSIVIVPNVDLSKNKIVNYTYGKER